MWYKETKTADYYDGMVLWAEILSLSPQTMRDLLYLLFVLSWFYSTTSGWRATSSSAMIHHQSHNRRAFLKQGIFGGIGLLVPTWSDGGGINDGNINTMNHPVAVAVAAECDEACQRTIQQRRAMLQQSRSTTSRAQVFELSRQRAALYNTTSQAASCPQGIPCW
jgi:hypothetical protein